MTQKKAEKIAKMVRTIASKIELIKIQSSIIVTSLIGQFEMTTKIKSDETIEALEKKGYLITKQLTYISCNIYKVEW